MRRLAVALAAVLLLSAAPATADAYSYPGQRPARDALALEMRDLAVEFWRVRGVVACPSGVAIYYAPSLRDSDGLDPGGRGRGCEAWVVDDARVPSWLIASGDEWWLRYQLRTAAWLWIHEIGHALGLEHDQMRDGGKPPWAARTWARRKAAMLAAR